MRNRPYYRGDHDQARSHRPQLPGHESPGFINNAEERVRAPYRDGPRAQGAPQALVVCKSHGRREQRPDEKREAGADSTIPLLLLLTKDNFLLQPGVVEVMCDSEQRAQEQTANHENRCETTTSHVELTGCERINVLVVDVKDYSDN